MLAASTGVLRAHVSNAVTKVVEPLSSMLSVSRKGQGRLRVYAPARYFGLAMHKMKEPIQTIALCLCDDAPLWRVCPPISGSYRAR